MGFHSSIPTCKLGVWSAIAPLIFRNNCFARGMASIIESPRPLFYSVIPSKEKIYGPSNP